MSAARIVAVDARRNTWAPQYGLSRYARSLIRGVRALDPPDLGVRPIDIAGSRIWEDDRPMFVREGHGLGRRLLQEQVDIPRRASEYDLLHLCWHEGPVRPRRPHVVAVHDLDPIENPHHYRPRFRAYYSSLLHIYVRSAARIVVSSEATAEALTTRWPRARSVVIPLGVDPVFTQAGPGYPAIDPSLRVIAYTGGYNPRKRLPDVVAAFERIAVARENVVLLLTGAPPPGVRELLATSPAATHIVLTGTLDDLTLASVYRSADVIVYASELEGFGFPVLEAFASGTPVVATSSGSIPELAGDAAVLTEVGDVLALEQGIARLLDDEDAAGASRRAGLERAQLYTWERTAQATLECWRSVLA